MGLTGWEGKNQGGVRNGVGELGLEQVQRPHEGWEVLGHVCPTGAGNKKVGLGRTWGSGGGGGYMVCMKGTNNNKK